MGKRQKRINITKNTDSLLSYQGERLTLICLSGKVFYGTLKKVNKEALMLLDSSGNKVDLPVNEIKELIIDYVSH